MPIISVTRRAVRPCAVNRVACCAYIHQKPVTPKSELFVSSTFPDNFDDPEFIVERGGQETIKPTRKAAGSSEAAVKADRGNIKPESQSSASKKRQGTAPEEEPEPRLDDM